MTTGFMFHKISVLNIWNSENLRTVSFCTLHSVVHHIFLGEFKDISKRYLRFFMYYFIEMSKDLLIYKTLFRLWVQCFHKIADLDPCTSPAYTSTLVKHCMGIVFLSPLKLQQRQLAVRVSFRWDTVRLGVFVLVKCFKFDKNGIN